MTAAAHLADTVEAYLRGDASSVDLRAALDHYREQGDHR